MDEIEIDIQELKHKTTKNVLFLSLRNVGIQAISIVGFFLLTLLLGTGDVGLFAIVSESVSILGYFSDIGLAAALIQKKAEIKKEDLQTTFTIQQILVLIALIAGCFAFSKYSSIKGYGSREFWIFISLCFSFVCASLKTIPSVLLERKLNFKLISTIDIIENACFYCFAVLFAFLGYGVFSYAIATFIRSLVGLIIIYIFSAWPIGFSFNWETAKSLFKYGIPYQLNSFISMAKDRLSHLLVAGIIGRNSFGILSWAQKGPRLALSFMDAIMRVTFPTFARLQDHKEFLKKSLEKSIYCIALFVFPVTAGIAMVAPDLINFIPKYTKWMPAVAPLYFYAANVIIASVTTPLTNAFNAIGKITLTTKFMIMWTALTWIFFPILSFKFGYMGTAWATLIVGASSFIVWFMARKVFDIQIIKIIMHPTIATTLMIVACLLIQPLNFTSLINIISKILISVLIYGIYMALFSKDEIIWFWHQLLCLKNKNQN